MNLYTYLKELGFWEISILHNLHISMFILHLNY
jgi:hypothetical protein